MIFNFYFYLFLIRIKSNETNLAPPAFYKNSNLRSIGPESSPKNQTFILSSPTLKEDCDKDEEEGKEDGDHFLLFLLGGL